MNINDIEGLIVGNLLNTAQAITNPTTKVLSTDVDGKIILVNDVSSNGNNEHPTIEGLTNFPTVINNYANVPLPTNNGYRYSASGSSNWTGLVAGSPGQKLTIWSNSNHDLHLKYEDSGSLANNRFIGWNNKDINIRKGGVAVIQYSSVMSRWVLISMSRDN